MQKDLLAYRASRLEVIESVHGRSAHAVGEFVHLGVRARGAVKCTGKRDGRSEFGFLLQWRRWPMAATLRKEATMDSAAFPQRPRIHALRPPLQHP